MHVIKHAHTHRHTNTQRMGVGRVEMGVVSLLLPDCCHGDADGAFTAGWDSHFAIKMHTHGHHFSLMLAHALPLRAASPLSQLSGKQKKKKKIQETERDFLQVWKSACVCVCVYESLMFKHSREKLHNRSSKKCSWDISLLYPVTTRCTLSLPLSLSPHYISIPPTPSIPHPWYPFYREWCHPWACNCQRNCWNFCQDFTCEQKMQASLNFHML